MKKIKINEIKVFTDEWIGYLIYCSPNEGQQVIKKMFPEVSPKFENSRGLTFTNSTKVPAIWINSELVKTEKLKLLVLIHESYHLIKHIGENINIEDDEWFAETLEWVVKQGIKILK